MNAFADDPSSLIYGIGNVGRQDDGLGWAFIDELEAQERYASRTCAAPTSSTSKTPT